MSNLVRRISIWGGPGSGKSTLAARLFADLKMSGYDIELIQEFVKTMAHEGRRPESFDQLLILGEQTHREDLILRFVPTIITDCPVAMCASYAQYYQSPGWEHLVAIARDFDVAFPALNILIHRSVPYTSKGRYQTVEQAAEFDVHLLNYMQENVPNFLTVDVLGRKDSSIPQGVVIFTYAGILHEIETALNNF